VIAVFVGEKNTIELLRRNAAELESGENLAGAQAAINK
jgi:hypothetical protein